MPSPYLWFSNSRRNSTFTGTEGKKRKGQIGLCTDCTRKHLEASYVFSLFVTASCCCVLSTYPISFLGYKEMLVLPTNGLKTYSLPLSSRSRTLTNLWTELDVAFELTAAAAFAFWIVSLHCCTFCKLFTSPLYNSDSRYLTQNASNAQNEQRKHAYKHVKGNDRRTENDIAMGFMEMKPNSRCTHGIVFCIAIVRGKAGPG